MQVSGIETGELTQTVRVYECELACADLDPSSRNQIFERLLDDARWNVERLLQIPGCYRPVERAGVRESHHVQALANLAQKMSDLRFGAFPSCVRHPLGEDR